MKITNEIIKEGQEKMVKAEEALQHELGGIRAGRASIDVAGALGIDAGSPVLEIERRAFSASKKLIEYMQMAYEYTKYSFEVELKLSAT